MPLSKPEQITRGMARFHPHAASSPIAGAGRGNPPTSPQAAQIAAMEARLIVAAQTLAGLPQDAWTKPLDVRSTWPEMKRGCRFTYGETRQTSRPRPTPAQIDALDHIVQLMWRLSPPARQLVWGRACRIRWALLGARLGRSRTSLNRDYRQALALLVRWDTAENTCRSKNRD